jgi:hypothetical protein
MITCKPRTSDQLRPTLPVPRNEGVRGSSPRRRLSGKPPLVSHILASDGKGATGRGCVRPGSGAIVGWRVAAALKLARIGSDQIIMNGGERLPVKAGPVPDKLTIWPVDDGRYGLDATFQGASGYQRAEHHQDELTQRGVPHSFRQEFDGGWTLRFGPLSALEVASALSAFVY